MPEAGGGPCVDRMALSAVEREAQGGMIGCTLEVVVVARIAVLRKAGVGAAHVALRTA